VTQKSSHMLNPDRRLLKLLSLSIVFALIPGLSSSCKAPRDPDLDRRIAEARITKALPKSIKKRAKDKEPTKAAKAKSEDEGLPPAGSVELRPYGDAERKAILAAVPPKAGTPADAKVLNYEATFVTSVGDIVCALDYAEAPQAVTNFIALALGKRAWRDPDTKDIARTPFYKNLSFHRTIKDFIIQTGRPGTGASSGPGWTIPRESGIAERYDASGAMGMVDAGEDTHGSQFFITLRGQKSLKGKYTPFGRCTSMEVLKVIANAEKEPPANPGKSATKPLKPVRIDALRIVALSSSKQGAEEAPSPPKAIPPPPKAK